MSKESKPQPYKHDVYTCIKKIRTDAMKNDKSITGVFFDMANISRLGTAIKRYKTAQVVRIERGKKTEKTFIGHDYCPFCGKKF